MLARLLAVIAAATLLIPSVFAIAEVLSDSDNPPILLNISDPSLMLTSPGSILNAPDQMQNIWRGDATIEVYIASTDRNNVGYVAGPMMYNLIQKTLRVDCPDTIGGKSNHKCWEKSHAFETRFSSTKTGITDTYNYINVISSEYKNMQVRNLLIGAIAATYEESTKLARNCYYAPDKEAGMRYCHAPIQVGAYTEDSHIAINLVSDDHDHEPNVGRWHCCETREYIDKRLDELMGEFNSVYPTPRRLPKLAECHVGCAVDEREFSTDVDKLLLLIMSLDV